MKPGTSMEKNTQMERMAFIIAIVLVGFVGLSLLQSPSSTGFIGTGSINASPAGGTAGPTNPSAPSVTDTSIEGTTGSTATDHLVVSFTGQGGAKERAAIEMSWFGADQIKKLTKGTLVIFPNGVCSEVTVGNGKDKKQKTISYDSKNIPVWKCTKKNVNGTDYVMPAQN